jgi:PAS domain S-box-containing protein
VQFGFQRDTSPFTFAVGGAIIAWGLFRYDLFSVVPVARDRVVENIADAVLVLDAQNRLIDFNPAARRLSELTEEMIGTPIFEVFRGAEDMVERVLYAETQPVDVEYIDDEAGPIQLEVTLSPIIDRRGRLQGRVAVLRDVTERRQIEQRLRKARRKAEEADRIKTQFLASMSHELRTPLNGVLSLTEMVMLEMFGPLNEKQIGYLQKAIDSGEHLLALINDILDINKIQAGKLDLFVEEDVSRLDELAQVASSAQTLLMNKPVRLITDIDASLPTLDCDRRRMRQVMLNLVANACKFTDQGTVTVSAKYLTDKRCLQLMVSDTGPGIDPADLDIIFEPFVQTATGKANGSGTGLGLPISRHLVEMHQGRIWVESEPGDGAAFFVEIPVHRELQPLA